MFIKQYRKNEQIPCDFDSPSTNSGKLAKIEGKNGQTFGAFTIVFGEFRYFFECGSRQDFPENPAKLSQNPHAFSR